MDCLELRKIKFGHKLAMKVIYAQIFVVLKVNELENKAFGLECCCFVYSTQKKMIFWTLALIS